ncbi:MAG: S-layer family protein [Phormidesmis sp. RL_2_1]|nr:S-layer family protein [Phormidesmis sp. RL_2_1]
MLSVTDGASVEALTEGEGAAGNLAIISDRVDLQNRGRLTVSGQGKFSAGNLDVTANEILLVDQSLIEANTESGSSGNITLNTQDLLLLRRNSSIRTNATGTATGGNIAINAPNGFLIAVPEENSDITANAFEGRGGRVEIEARGIFGFVSRSSAELSQLLGTNDPSQLDPARLPTNDITAISQTNPALSGEVIIDTPETGPTTEAVELPAVLTETEVAQGCRIDDDRAQNTFVITGRGGCRLFLKRPLTVAILMWG